MTAITITANLDDSPWKDCAEECREQGLGTVTRIGRLPNGTEGGHSTVTILVEMPDGRKVLAQTTLRLLVGAVAFLKTGAEMNGENPG